MKKRTETKERPETGRSTRLNRFQRTSSNRLCMPDTTTPTFDSKWKVIRLRNSTICLGSSWTKMKERERERGGGKGRRSRSRRWIEQESRIEIYSESLPPGASAPRFRAKTGTEVNMSRSIRARVAGQETLVVDESFVLFSHLFSPSSSSTRFHTFLFLPRKIASCVFCASRSNHSRSEYSRSRALHPSLVLLLTLPSVWPTARDRRENISSCNNNFQAIPRNGNLGSRCCSHRFSKRFFKNTRRCPLICSFSDRD